MTKRKVHELQVTRSMGITQVYLNDFRITGRETKPRGNIEIVYTFKISDEDLRKALEQ